MFNIICGILNVAGWMLAYFLSGGWAAETQEVRLESFLIVLIASAVTTIGSLVLNTESTNPLLNIWRLIEISIFFSAPFINLFYGEADVFSKVICFFTCGFTYGANYAVVTSSVPFVVKVACIGFFILVNIPFMGNPYAEAILAFAPCAALPLTLVLGIKKTYFEE